MINAGTNNANANTNPNITKINEEMTGILADIWEAPGMADTCIILSTLLPTTHGVGKEGRIPINEEYRRIVGEFENDKCIYLADMEPPGEGADFMGLDLPIWDDDPKIHPNVSTVDGLRVRIYWKAATSLTQDLA